MSLTYLIRLMVEWHPRTIAYIAVVVTVLLILEVV